jgi:hypothetical protein
LAIERHFYIDYYVAEIAKNPKLQTRALHLIIELANYYRYDEYLLESDIRKKFIFYLKHFNNEDPEVCREAKDVFDGIKAHLEKLHEGCHPIRDMRYDIPRFLQLM